MIKYLRVYADGTTERVDTKPIYGEVSATSDYYLNGLWYNPSTSTAYNPQFTYASVDGKLLGVEVANGKVVDLHLSDTESDEIAPTLSLPAMYTKYMKADEYQGKNACTAWVNFDGTTTPPTIRDSYNVIDVVKVNTGVYNCYFEERMDKDNYSTGAGQMDSPGGIGQVVGARADTIDYFRVQSRLTQSEANVDSEFCEVSIFGGKE